MTSEQRKTINGYKTYMVIQTLLMGLGSIGYAFYFSRMDWSWGILFGAFLFSLHNTIRIFLMIAMAEKIQDKDSAP